MHAQLVEQTRRLDGVRFHDLYEEYPDLVIDVDREQSLLLEHEVVVFQHPLYWWSTPAILKEWQDLVLEHGWAYGSGATALRGKLFLHVLSAGGSEESYRPGGEEGERSLEEYLLPLYDTVRLCGMELLPPFTILDTHRVSEVELQSCSARYRRVLEGLRDGTLDLHGVRALDRLDARVDGLLDELLGEQP